VKGNSGLIPDQSRDFWHLGIGCLQGPRGFSEATAGHVLQRGSPTSRSKLEAKEDLEMPAPFARIATVQRDSGAA